VAVIGLGSAKGSPGVTTTVLALAATWPRAVLLAECDPAGGDVVAGFLRAQPQPAATLLDLALAARRGLEPADVLGHCLRLSADDELAFLPGVSDPTHVVSTSPAWPELAAAFDALGHAEPARDVLVDCGRLDARATPVELLARCDLIVLVLRPRLPQVHHARSHLQVLRRVVPEGIGGPRYGLAVVGERPYPPEEVAQALGVPVLAVMPIDARAAAVLSDGAERGRWFDQSGLIRAARRAAVTIHRAASASRDDGGPRTAAATSGRGVAS
jgi:hypothetical protein